MLGNGDSVGHMVSRVGVSSSSCCPFINNLVGEAAVPFAAPSFRSLSDPSDRPTERGGLYRFESDRGSVGGGANRGNEPLRTAAPFFSEPFK